MGAGKLRLVSSSGRFRLRLCRPRNPLLPRPSRKGIRWRRWIGGTFLAVVVLIAGLALYLRLYGYDLAKQWLESPAGPRVAGKELGKAIKVYGEFAPMKLDDWTIVTDNFTSKGWPGRSHRRARRLRHQGHLRSDRGLASGVGLQHDSGRSRHHPPPPAGQRHQAAPGQETAAMVRDLPAQSFRPVWAHGFADHPDALHLSGRRRRHP